MAAYDGIVGTNGANSRREERQHPPATSAKPFSCCTHLIVLTGMYCSAASDSAASRCIPAVNSAYHSVPAHFFFLFHQSSNASVFTSHPPTFFHLIKANIGYTFPVRRLHIVIHYIIHFYINP